MSNSENHSEDLTILAAVEALERGIDAPGGEPRQDESAETLTRLYTEVLGLVPFALDPVAPSPEARVRLMALIHGDETRPAAEPVRAAVPLSASPEARAPRLVPPGRPAPAVVRRPSRWPLALAAALALVALGLSAWLYLQLGQQRQTIAQLRQEVAAERARAEQALTEVRQVQADARDLQELRERFTLVTSPAVEVSPMRPVGRKPLQPEARGILFVAADHQHWYLSLRNLQPAATGKAYKLWFMTDRGAVSSGHFTAEPGKPADLESAHMPAGTKGVLVTLEDDPQAPAPTGPPILQAAAVYKIS
ncbi:MAG TPA: anti-sigma factor [Thermoanaerobaculia bacterium]